MRRVTAFWFKSNISCTPQFRGILDHGSASDREKIHHSSLLSTINRHHYDNGRRQQDEYLLFRWPYMFWSIRWRRPSMLTSLAISFLWWWTNIPGPLLSILTDTEDSIMLMRSRCCWPTPRFRLGYFGPLSTLQKAPRRKAQHIKSRSITFQIQNEQLGSSNATIGVSRGRRNLAQQVPEWRPATRYSNRGSSVPDM